MYMIGERVRSRKWEALNQLTFVLSWDVQPQGWGCLSTLLPPVRTFTYSQLSY